MKTLYLVRHAKAATLDDQPDIDRSLNARGNYDAHLVSKLLQKNGIVPEVIISSPAIRALSTALIIAGNLNYSKEHIVIKERLYETDVDEYIGCLQSIDDAISKAMLVAHNPIISATAGYLCPKAEEMPTCAVVAIEFGIKSWSEITKNSGELQFSLTPAMLKS